jgi:hypothetical protein
LDLGKGDERGPQAGKPMRRRTEIRDRTCTHPRCRTPAHGTDGDHIQEWARGGATRDGNIGSACRHDHRLRHEGGWIVTQPDPGHLVSTSRLGVHLLRTSAADHLDLPDPILRAPLYRHQMPRRDTDQNDPTHGDGVPVWQEPARLELAPERDPAPDPDQSDESPPF